MSNDSYEERMERVSEVTGLDSSPLAEYEPMFHNLKDNVFETYLLSERFNNVSEETRRQWELTFSHWQDWMAAQGRHPACPSKSQVIKFYRWCQNDKRDPDSRPVAGKRIQHLQAFHRWLVGAENFPLTEADNNPYSSAIESAKITSTSSKKRNYPRLSIETLREHVENIKNIRERALTVAQLKLGCRSGELGNIKLSEINLTHPDLKDHYTQLGTHPEVVERPDTVYIEHGEYEDIDRPGRKGNKRKVATLLPVDEELKQILIDWLLIRPDNGSDWLFLTDHGGHIKANDLHHTWSVNWHPEYKFDSDDERDTITPHYARHYFTSWFDGLVSPTQLAYMRGDNSTEAAASSSMWNYMHSYYEDIKNPYLENVFQLYLNPV